MNGRFCGCKACKRAKRKGLVLGSMWAHYWVFGGLMKVSAYVPHHRLKKGRVRGRRPGNERIDLD